MTRDQQFLYDLLKNASHDYPHGSWQWMAIVRQMSEIRTGNDRRQ